MNRIRFTRIIETTSVVYIAIPTVIFFIGFLNWVWSISASLCLAAVVWRYLRHSVSSSNLSIRDSHLIDYHSDIPYTSILFCGIGTLLLTLLFYVGAGQFANNFDGVKHTAMLSHLTLSDDWTQVVSFRGQDHHIVYYIAYYIVPAVFGRVLGNSILISYIAIIVWTFVGVFLASAWCLLFSKKAAWWVALVFFLFSGPELIGLLLNIVLNIQGYLPHTSTVFRYPSIYTEGTGNLFVRFYHNTYPVNFAAGERVTSIFQIFHDRMNWWAHSYLAFELSSIVTGIMWIPQHSIPSWLLGGLLLKNIAQKRVLPYAAFFVALAMLWSVFVAIGIVFFVGLHFFLMSTTSIKKRIIAICSRDNVICLLPIFCLTLYFASSAFSSQTFHVPILGVSVQYAIVSLTALVLDGLIFSCVVYAAHWYMKRKGGIGWLVGDLKEISIIAFVVILTFFCLRYAPTNAHDFPKNTSHIAVFILLILTIRLLEYQSHDGTRVKALRLFQYGAILLLAIGSLSFVGTVMDGMRKTYTKSTVFPQVRQYPITESTLVATHQYMGDIDSLFYRSFARKKK